MQQAIIASSNLNLALTVAVHKANNLKFMQPSPTSVYNCHSPNGSLIFYLFFIHEMHYKQHIRNDTCKILDTTPKYTRMYAHIYVCI